VAGSYDDLDLDLASARDRVAHRWVQARPADQARAGAIGASVYTPDDPGVCQQDADGPSLITLAATLGIALFAGERLIEATGPDAVELPEHDDAAPADFAAMTPDVHAEGWTMPDGDADD
jgi:hypothetical protein